MTVNHHRHLAVLQRSQAYYKKSILAHRSGCILKACCVNALPSMAVALRERTPREEGVIRLVLYLIRNILQIKEPGTEHDSTWEEISKASTIESLDSQGVLNILLSITSGVPEQFEQQDVIIIEIIFYLLLGINMQHLATSMLGTESTKVKDPLAHILKSEQIPMGSKAQSRHTRFGTTIVLKQDGGQRKVVTGHSALLDEGAGLQKLDATKKWHKPSNNRANKSAMLGGGVHLSSDAQRRLCGFLSQALISGFSCLFQNVRKAIERDSERVIGSAHIAQLFFVGGSLMEFGRVLKQNGVILMDSRTLTIREFSTMLQPETFIILFRHIREGLESKSWDHVRVGCRYFTQALLMVLDMIYSQDQSEKSIAENIFSRIFYEETLQDLMIAVLRSGRKQALEYLDTLTEMIHVYLRCLERYSKSSAGMVVRSKRAPKLRSGNVETYSGSDSDTKKTGRLQAEKLFDFQQCESKFLSQSAVEPFLDFLSHYPDLDPSQTKRCINFLHRVFVKRGATVGLFHIKAIRLLQSLARDTRGSPDYSEVTGFVQYFSKHLVRKLNEYPILFVEILFQKSSKISYFLQHGEDRDRNTREPRLPAMLTIEGALDKDQQIAVAVSFAAQHDTCRKQFDWVETVLYRAAEERAREMGAISTSTSFDEGYDGMDKLRSIVIEFENTDQARLHFLSSELQLVMSVLGFASEGSRYDEFCYILPNDISPQILQGNITAFLQYRKSPISELDGRTLEDCLTARRRRSEAADTGLPDEFDADSVDEEFEFPDNLRDIKSGGTAKSRVSKKRRAIDESEARRRRHERKAKERERRQGIKSGLYIASSDDDSDVERDREFFENERVLREAMSKATINGEGNSETEKRRPHKKRSMLEETAREPKRLRKTFGSDSGSNGGGSGGGDEEAESNDSDSESDEGSSNSRESG
ncbi:Topoisomerase 1-associated factor 1, variant 3 [Orbilia blumenaviensis]